MKMLPKNENELIAFFKLLEIYEAKKLVDAGVWAAGTVDLYRIRISRIEELKKEYFKMVNP
ncbi:MAG TPA: hypothetical protein VFZ33_16705 [Chitinophagaceae bacterium]